MARALVGSTKGGIQFEYVGLNVGGKIYRATRTTLTRYQSVICDILKEEYFCERDKHGNVLINHDGKLFRHVLNYMRYDKLTLPTGFAEDKLLQLMAEGLKFKELEMAIENWRHYPGDQ